MNVLFFGSLLLYFAAAVLQFIGTLFKKDKVAKIAWLIFLAGLAAQTAYLLVRGVTARRLPLSNQFEFATAFAWGIALMLLIVRLRLKADMTVTVEHGAETGETHGFVQPVTAVSGGEPFSVGPLGAADRRCWRYLGSAEVSVAQGDHILCEGKRYRVRRAESVKLGALVTHYWAVLDREEETA